MTDNKTTPNIFVPEALLHLLFLIGAFMFFNPVINFPYPAGNKYELIKYYSLLITEVCTVFMLISLPFPLKVSKKCFLIIILLFFPTIIISSGTIPQFIIVITKNIEAPEIRTFFKYYNRYVAIIPLILYILGYINKKLFWIIASIPIACFFFSVIWFFILSEPLYYSHLLDDTFTY